LDAEGDRVDCEYVYEEGTKVLSLRCSSEWLKGATYPVKIDPSLSYYTLETDDSESGYDQFGLDVVIGDFDGDGYADVLSGAPNNDDEWSNGGRGYIFYGPFTGNENAADVILALSTADFQNYGRTVGVGDFNGDGYDDAVLSGNNVDVLIVYGSNSLPGTITSPDVSVSEQLMWSEFGTSIASANLNGDSNDDLLIGATNEFPENGKVYIYYYDSTDWGDGTIDDNPDDTLESVDNDQVGQFGQSIAIGNFYSGNLDDIAVGEPYYDVTGSFNLIGRVHIFNGDIIDNNNDNPNFANNFIVNPQGTPDGDSDLFGFSIAAGDFNSDFTTNDFDDIIVGEPQNDESAAVAGRAYIFLCDDGPAGWQTDDPAPTDIPNPEGANGGNDQFGYSVGAGDVFNDGVDDFFVGAPYSDNGGTGNGALYVFDCDGLTVPTAYSSERNGTSGEEHLGWSVAGGRFSSDTEFLLAAGAPDWDDSSPAWDNAGRVYVMPIPEFSAKEIPIIVAGIILFGIVYRKKRKKVRE
jgi:hypothetical protein